MAKTYQERAEELAAGLLSLSMEGVEVVCTKDQNDIDLRFKDFSKKDIAVAEVSLDADEDAERFLARYRKNSVEITEPELKTVWSIVLKPSFQDFRKIEVLRNLITEMDEHGLDDSDWAIGEWGRSLRKRIFDLGISSIRDSKSPASPGRIYLFAPIQAGMMNFTDQDFDDWIQSRLESPQFIRKANQLITDPIIARHLVIVMGSGTPWQLTSALLIGDSNRFPTPRRRPPLNSKIEGLWILDSSGMNWFFWNRTSNNWCVYKLTRYPSFVRCVVPSLIIQCD